MLGCIEPSAAYLGIRGVTIVTRTGMTGSGVRTNGGTAPGAILTSLFTRSPAVASTLPLDELMLLYIPRKDHEKVRELVRHLIMLEPTPEDLQDVVSRQLAKYEGHSSG